MGYARVNKTFQNMFLEHEYIQVYRCYKQVINIMIDSYINETVVYSQGRYRVHECTSLNLPMACKVEKDLFLYCIDTIM